MSYVAAGVVVVASYFLGSIPTGYMLARARGIDIRERGSGNIGAVNVARSLGKKLGVWVLFADALKGAIPVLVVRGLGLDDSVHPLVLTACGVAAVVGHCFPVWLNFRGGKGVATSFGLFLALDPAIALGLVLIFAVVYGASRVASLGSITAAATLPVWLWLAHHPPEVWILGIIVAAIVIAKHRDNIRRLVRGEEHRL